MDKLTLLFTLGPLPQREPLRTPRCIWRHFGLSGVGLADLQPDGHKKKLKHSLKTTAEAIRRFGNREKVCKRLTALSVTQMASLEAFHSEPGHKPWNSHVGATKLSCDTTQACDIHTKRNATGGTQVRACGFLDTEAIS